MATTTVLTHLDLAQNMLIAALLHPTASDPGTPANGQIWYNSTSHTFKGYANGSVFTFGSSGGGQPADQDLTDIAGLSPTNDDVIQRKAGAWTNRTMAQLATDLTTLAPKANAAFSGTFTLPTGLTGVVRADAGVVSIDSDVTDIVAAASATAQGKVELATDAETTTGTDTTRALTPANLTSQIGSRVQAYDADLTTIAGLTATTNNMMVAVSSAWASRTPAQVKTTLAITSADVSDFTSAVNTLIAAVVDAAPTALDTLNELAAALGDDPNFATTMTTALGLRVRQYVANVGDGAATSYTLTHGLAASEDVTVEVRQAAGNKQHVLVDWRVLSTTQVRLDFNVAPTTNQYRVIVRGL